MKKILTIILFTSILFAQDLSFVNYHWQNDNDKFLISAQYGINAPQHLYLEKVFNVNEHIYMGTGLVLARENDVAATYCRNDFPLFSTGRFYRGDINIHYDLFYISLGRIIPKQDPVKQLSIWNQKRITGDGIKWAIRPYENWSFENSIEFLPNDKLNRYEVYERILNYHAIKYQGEKLYLMAGELSLYTGLEGSINWHHSNPFVPYVINYGDTYPNYTEGYLLDNQNNLILLGVGYNFSKNMELKSLMYIDDFMIDKPDRSIYTDRFLWLNELYLKSSEKFRSSLTFKLSNPAFGWHGGPFTTYTVYGFELLPHTFGEYYSAHLKMEYKFKKLEASLNTSLIHKAVIDTIPDGFFYHAVQDQLEKETIYSVDLRVGYYFLDNLALWSQIKYRSEEEWVFNFILQTYF